MGNSSVKKNIVLNYMGTSVTALAPILALPWYLNALGPKQWGLVSFAAIFLALFSLIDAGMSQVLVREISIRLSDGSRRAAIILFGFERIYWIFAILSALLMIVSADFVANHWLNLGDLPQALGRFAVAGGGLIFAGQFPGLLYRSVLIGAQAQLALNGLMMVGALLRHVGGVVVVLVWPSIPAYLGWQAFIALIETLMRAKWAWKILGGRNHEIGWDKKELQQMSVLVISMSGAVLLGVLIVQVDKIILSRMLPIDQLGYYMIASSIALGVLQLIYPITQAVLPHMIHLRQSPGALWRFNIKLMVLLTSLVCAATVIFALFGHLLLEIWLKNSSTIAKVYPIIAVLLLGTAMNVLYNVGYLNWLVLGRMERVLQVNAISLTVAIALIPIFVASYGMIGAAFGWLTINGIGLLLSLEWLKGRQHAPAASA